MRRHAVASFEGMTLEQIGWTEFFAEHWAAEFESPHQQPGRIAASHRGFFTVWTAEGSFEAPALGKLIRSPDTKPVTGDWVAVRRDPASVVGVLPRRTRVVRKAPGEKTVQQVLGANVDTLFIVAGLDRDFNLRRLERFLVVAFESGAEPVVVLNKADLVDPAEALEQAQGAAQGAPVLVTSAVEGRGVEQLERFLSPGRTAALIGSSGVGKSHLTNALLGSDERAVGAVRESDGRGRHTTVGRELVIAPRGWLLMDLPGVREVQAWSESGVEQTFGDVEELFARCRFRDCSHSTEPGCAVREALETRALDANRYRNYQKVQTELKELARRRDTRPSVEEKRRGSGRRMPSKGRPKKR